MFHYGRIFLCFSLCTTVPVAAAFASHGACYSNRHNIPGSHALFPRGRVQRCLTWSALIRVNRSISSPHTVVSDSNFYLMMRVDDQAGEKLVLREFSMPLQTSLGAYERRVRNECLKEGGPTASLIRWHISHADRQTGHAFVETELSSNLLLASADEFVAAGSDVAYAATAVEVAGVASAMLDYVRTSSRKLIILSNGMEWRTIQSARMWEAFAVFLIAKGPSKDTAKIV